MKHFPALATMFAHSFMTQHIREKYNLLLKGIETNDFALLEEVHHLTSGLKALHTQEAFDMMLEIRQSLGGAGFTAWSGLPSLIANFAPLPTFEGDNTVMAQQSFTYLMKQAKKLFGGIVKPEMDPSFHYIAEVNSLLIKKSPCKRMEDFLDLENINEALKVNVGLKLKRLAIEAFRLRDEWNKKEFINGPYALEVVQVALEHLRYTSFLFFKQRVQKGDITCP